MTAVASLANQGTPTEQEENPPGETFSSRSSAS